jgi:signal transduction histidine kinase
VSAAVAAVTTGRSSWLRSLRGWLSGPRPIIVPVTLGGTAVVALALFRGVSPLWAVLVLLAAATLAEAFPIPIEGVAAGETSFGTVFVAGAAALYGWQEAAVVGACAMLIVELRLRRRLAKVAFNSSLYALSGGAAGLAGALVPHGFRFGLGCSLAFYVVNVSVLTIVLARVRGERYLRLSRRFYRSTFVPFVVMAATTGILVTLWQRSPYYALLLAPPLILIVAYQRSLMNALTRQRELDQLKDEFIAVISHELRTPLASVFGGAVTLEQRELTAEMRQRLIGMIRSESTRLSKLVDDVLCASRLQSRRIEAETEPADPAAVLQDVVETARDVRPANVFLLTRAEEALPPVAAGADQLRRVLSNLVDNAIKYSPDGGTVEIAARRLPGRVLFAVEDEGIGIPPEERERIFEKFTRLDPQMTRGIGGTGLGLYICHEIVTQLDGRIWVAGNEGRGSTFAFEIPIADTKGGS